MAGKDNDVGADIRMSALLVSALVKASDDELAGFLQKRQNLEIDEAQLMRVRDLIRELVHLLKAPSDDRWGDVDRAYDAIVGGDAPPARASAHPLEDEAGAEEMAGEPDPPAVHPSIERPPALGELLGAPDPPPASVRSYAPSPWVEPSRAHEHRHRNSAPLIAPPTAVAEPVPPPRVVPPAVVPAAPASALGMAAGGELEIADEVSQAGSTVIPPPMDSEPPRDGYASLETPPVATAAEALPPPPPAASQLAGDTQPPFDEDDEEETDRREPRTKTKTLPPVAMNDQALPFPSARPNPETPGISELPPEALASVIAGLPPMTVVSYAALAASSEALPVRRAETHAKFGVTDCAVRQSLDAAWQAKLDEDPRLRTLYTALHQQFRSWLGLLF